MNPQRTDVFFYGLFMDRNILGENRVRPLNPRRAYVDHFRLCIGQRATLVHSRGARAYGVIYSVRLDELECLYGAPGLDQYRAEEVLAYTMEGEETPALCYNLQNTPRPDDASREYAASLRDILARLKFPVEYIRSVS